MNDRSDASKGSQYEAFVASTRPVKLAGESHYTSFAREALENMARQVEDECVWLNVEHLSFLPPAGRWRHAEVRPTDDGESELYMFGDDLPQLRARESGQLKVDLGRLSESPDLPISAQLTYDRRNFDPDTAKEIQRESGGMARPTERWSELPPIEYTLVIPVVWGATKFMGAFLDQLGKAAGEALASKIASWTRRSKNPDRVAIFVLDFELSPRSHLCGYVLAPAIELESAVNDAMEAAEQLASIAGVAKERDLFPNMKQSAFYFVEGSWKLAWWTDGDAVFRTDWFEQNPPDISGVLGRESPE